MKKFIFTLLILLCLLLSSAENESYMKPFVNFYGDSDTIKIFSRGINNFFSISPSWKIILGIETKEISIDRKGPFSLGSQKETMYNTVWLRNNIQFGKLFKINGKVGVASIGEDESDLTVVYDVELTRKLWKGFNLTFGKKSDYFLVSPRTALLKLKYVSDMCSLYWDMKKFILAVDGSYDILSDKNKRWVLRVFPRYVLSRTSRLNLDIGVRGTWMEYEKDMNNGYWDPKLFQSYMMTVLGYWGLSIHSGISFQLYSGILKDDRMDDFKIGYGIDTHGIFRIYKNIILDLQFSYINNMIRQSINIYRAVLVGVGLKIIL